MEQPEYFPHNRIESDKQEPLLRALTFQGGACPKRQQCGCKYSAGGNQERCAADIEGIGQDRMQQQVDSGTETKTLDESNQPRNCLISAALLQLNRRPEGQYG